MNESTENTETPLAIVPPQDQERSMIDVAQSRAAQETQAAMIIAQNRPRNQVAAHNRIMEACKRPAMAEAAVYAYPKGGTTVTGPSIRLAECMAQNWGNLDYGIIELEQKHGESVMMAYCWDLETNTRSAQTFTVKHERYTKHGTVKLTDPRDIYEMGANMGARRLRSRILAIIPGDIVEAAVAQCTKTMEGQGDGPLIDRAKEVVKAFETFSVTQAMIEARLGHTLDAIIEPELVTLRTIFKSLKDGAAKATDFFDVPSTGTKADRIKDKVKKGGANNG